MPEAMGTGHGLLRSKHVDEKRYRSVSIEFGESRALIRLACQQVGRPWAAAAADTERAGHRLRNRLAQAGRIGRSGRNGSYRFLADR
ncbi:hypothetical protein B7760_01493 [Burkholderia glumae]|uniref:hypothetical protein n=2 Tax=Burkholderia glumae TaxID=337 RepID=UPI00157AA3C5|nr:hypothetical protein [Burkholderia glumae]QKM47480.1 hypothetical protein B7760_01493 [Burkholderia glumae]